MTVPEILALDDFQALQTGFDAALRQADEAQQAFGQAVAQMELTQAAHAKALAEASAARDRAFEARDEFQRWVTALAIINERLSFLSQLEAN